jgi:hypothetical protein
MLDCKIFDRILSVIGGMALMLPAPVALGGALQPDLRHWKRVPAVPRQQAPESLP